MDDLISIFFSNNFTEEQQTLLYKALGVISVFGLSNYGEEISHIVMQEGDQHKEVICDQVFAYVEEGIDSLISSHRLILENDPSLSFKVSLLEGIYGLAYREDYRPYVLILENQEKTNEEKFAEIVSDVTGTSAPDILDHLSWVFDGTLQRLQTLVEAKTIEEASVEDINLLKKIRKNLLIFETAFGIPKAINDLSQLQVAKGVEFDTYLQLLGEEIIDLSDLEGTTWRLIWMALISKDGTDNPQKLLLEKTEQFFTDLRVQNQFSSMLQKAMGHYQEHKEHLK